MIEYPLQKYSEGKYYTCREITQLKQGHSEGPKPMSFKEINLLPEIYSLRKTQEDVALMKVPPKHEKGTARDQKRLHDEMENTFLN